MKEKLAEETIALRVAKEFKDGDCVNLGLGIPNLCSLFIPEGRTVLFQSENGVLGYGPIILEDELDRVDIQYVDAGGRFFTHQEGMSFFDMDVSFDMIRSGRLDITVLGAFQVSEKGDLANWALPNDPSLTIGGGMDLAFGAKRVIVAMEHVTKENEPRILKKCTYPLTGKACVDLICTDIAVIGVTQAGLVLKEVAPGWTAEEVQELTEPKLNVADDLKDIEL
jgi:3-oxoacid CoA-transferase subunit B